MKRKEKTHMTKLALVVMTMLFTGTAMADEFQLTIKEDQQIIQIHDNDYKWLIDVDCKSQLKENEKTDITVSKRRVQVGKTITVKQGRKEQNCRVNQLAVVSDIG
mgnify:CR=1 FL=1